jgi:hypothetical protein
VSTTQTGPPRSASRKARATSPQPAPGGKTFDGTRASGASGTPPTLLPAIHVVKFASFAEAHQFHHSPVSLGSDSGPFRPTEEFGLSSRAGSSAPWQLLPALPNRQWASTREGGARGEREGEATWPHVEIRLEAVPELRDGDCEAGETRTNSGGRLLWQTARSAFADLASASRVRPLSSESRSRRSHPPFDLSPRQPQACAKTRSACHGQLRSARGADRLISGSHRPGRSRRSRAGRTVRVEQKG